MLLHTGRLISTRCDRRDSSASYLRERQKVIENTECVLAGERNAQDSRKCPEIPHVVVEREQAVEMFVTWSCGALVILVGAICHFRIIFALTEFAQSLTMHFTRGSNQDTGILLIILYCFIIVTIV